MQQTLAGYQWTPGPGTGQTSAAPHGPFTFKFYDAATMTFLGTLPCRNATYEKMMNGAGQLQATINLEDPYVSQLAPRPTVAPGRTFVFVDYNPDGQAYGVLDWGGMVWSYQYSRNARTLTIGATELWSYIAERVQAKDYSETWFGPADPMQIAKTVVSDALAVANSALYNLPVVVEGATSTEEWVSMSFPYIQLQTVGQIITMMQQMGWGIGFDYAVDVAYDSSGNPAVQLTLSNPRRGRTAADSGLVINTAQAVDYEYNADASQSANRLYGTSTSAGSILVIDTWVNALLEGYPILERLDQHPNINSVPTGNLQAVLKGVVAGDQAVFTYPVLTPTVTLPVGAPSTGLGTFLVGDDVRLIIPAAAGDVPADPLWPEGLDWFFRIVQQDVTVNPEGVATMKLTLNIPPSGGGPQPPPV